MNQSFIIVKKEILDALRDSKSMATAFLLPLILAVVSFGSTHFLVSMQSDRSEITLPVHGKEHILPLIDVFKEAGVKIVEAPQDPEQAIRQQKFDMVLVVSDSFVDDFRQQRSAKINLLSDHSRTNTQAKVARIRYLVNRWSQHTGALRLLTRNVSPGIAHPVTIHDINVTSDQRLASKILAGLPMFILMIAFASGIGMISDMASGERERRSLEPLLINPVSHINVFLGKWIAAAIVTFAVTAIGIALQFISIQLSPMAELGLRLTMGADKFFIILLILIPVIFFAVSLQLLVSFFARSFKDAQSYNSLIIMLPMAPGLYLTFNAGSAETWQMFVPLLGPTALFVDIIGGDGASLLHISITSLVSIACAFLCTLAGMQVLRQEKIIIG
ncbi:ABC transporter permease [Agarilytica rhodophyticola]|uniref:ABC transporter permease n=1 Tax=Agarilytica rhodophyticola TaxID=1737490 RepID=UPI000B346F77|nr:ABC transporter permease [Agarilytica rhodophyticola]